MFDESRLDALERSGARDELRTLAAACLRRAQALAGEPAAIDWFAAASDLYLRSGDRELARTIARYGLPYVPELVNLASDGFANVDRSDPAAMARAAHGRGTAPVIALYRTGAIEEAVATRYLTGKDRYFNAERAGEKKDPQWVIDDGWSLYIDAMVREVARSPDRDFQRRAFDGLVRSCGKSLVGCNEEKLRNIALVAAGMGDAPRMTEALTAAAQDLDTSPGRAFLALYVAGPWAHCEEVLSAAGRAGNTP